MVPLTGRGFVSQAVPSSAECRADRVFRHTKSRADFAVGPAFEMELPDDRRVVLGQVLQHSFDLIVVVDPFDIPVRVGVGLVDGRLVRRDVSELFCQSSLSDLSDDDSSRDDREVCRQRRLSAEAFQDGHVVGEERDKHLGTEVVDVVRNELSTASVGRVIDDVDEQSDESVDKVLPRTRLLGQATLQ